MNSYGKIFNSLTVICDEYIRKIFNGIILYLSITIIKLMSKSFLFKSFIEPQPSRQRTPIKGTEKLNDAIAAHDNKIYSLATEASKLRDRLDTLTGKAPKGEQAKIEGTQRAQEKYEYHIKNLENDKASLSKRLNIVLMELDKITAEKAEYEKQMSEQMRIGTELEEKLMKSENLSKVLNKNLQDDLKYEKELNDKLREEVSRYEAQKSQLMVQLREQQGLAEQFQKEVRNLEDAIVTKEADISNLVEQHEKVKKQLADKENELDGLRERLNVQGKNINDLEAEIQKVEDERNDLIGRMNDLTNKYEAYVTTMTKEREELARTTKKHIKLLTAKILSERLGIILKKQYYTSMNRLADSSHHNALKEHMTERVCGILNQMATRNLKSAFQHWCQTLLNWPNERQRREQLLSYICRDKSKRLAFRCWLNMCRAAKDNSKETSNAAKRLWNALESVGRGAVGEAFLRLKNKWLADSKKRLNLNKVLVQKYHKSLRLAFETWRVGAKKVRQRLAFEYLANQMAEGHMRQIAFHRFKDGIRQSRIDKLIRKFRLFRYWKNAKRKASQIKKAALIALKMEKADNDRAARKVFHSLQQNRVSSQLEKLNADLQSNVAKHQELSNTLEATRGEHEKKDKSLALKRLASHLANRVYPYFNKWRRYCDYYKKGLNKLRLITYTIYRNKIGSAMDLWRANAKRSALGKIENEIIEAGNKIQELEIEKLEKENSKGETEKSVKDKISEKLIRNFYVVDKLNLRRAFRQWNAGAKKVQDSDLRMQKMCRRLKNIKLWTALNHYRKQTKDIVTAELWENRIKYMRDKAQTNNLKRRIAKWKKYVERIKRAKAQVAKAIKEYELSESKWAVQQWLRVIREHRIHEKQQEAAKLKDEEKMLKNTIDDLVEENGKLEVQRTAHQETLKQRTLLTLWNNAVRQKKLDRESAFYRWKITATIKKVKQKRAHKVFKEIILSNERKGFSKWLATIREAHTKKKIQDLEDAKIKMKIGKTRSQLEVDKKVEERSDAEKLLERAKKSAARTHDISGRVIGHLIRKRDLNVYQPLHEAALKGWKEVSDKEKYLSGRLMNLAKRHMLEHIFIKMKNATIEKGDIEKRHKNFEKMMKLFGKGKLKDALSTWRNYAYLKSQENYRGKWEEKQNEIQNVEQNTEKLNEKLYANAESIINRRKKEKLLHNLDNATSYARFLKDKIDAFMRNKQYMRVKSAIQKWRNRSAATARLNLKTRKAIEFANTNLLRKTIRDYYASVRAIRSLPKALDKLSNKIYMHNKIRGTYILKSFAESHAEHLRATKQNGVERLGAVSERIFRERILVWLGLIGANARIVRTRSDKLARSIVSVYLRRLRDGLHSLSEEHAKKKLEESVESGGKQAQALKQLHEEVNLMEDTLIKEGYEPEFLEKSIKKMTTDKESLIRKAVARWLALGEKKDEVVHAVDRWKKFAEEKQLAKEKLQRLANFVSNRPLHKGFTRWRYFNVNSKEAFRGYTKDELVEEAILRGKQKAAISDEVQDKKATLAAEEKTAQKLEEKHNSSKYFGLMFMKKQNLGVLARAVERWRENINKTKAELLRQKLDELSSKMKEIIVMNDDLEEKNAALAVENEGLRQLSLESVDLAASMKELNKQKEQLSVDLADRATTIRKLLEDNKILKEKLLNAQQEAEKGFGGLARRIYVAEKEQQ